MTLDNSRFAFFKRPGFRRALALGGGAVVLAGVVFAGAALSAPRKSEPPKKVVTSLSPANESARLVDAAETALASGETTKAKELLRQALALDPSSEKAADLLDEAADSASDETTESTEVTPSPSGSPAAPTIPVDEQPFETKVDVKTLLPTAITGYWLGMVVATPGDAVVGAEPQPGSAAYRKMVRVLLTVRDRGTSKAADAFIPSVSKKLYAQDAAEVSVSGTHGYFGTDGKRLATLVFARGRYVFELLGTADTITAAATQPHLMTVAESFPTAP